MNWPGRSAGYRLAAGFGALLAGAALTAVFWVVRTGAAQNTEVPEVASHDTQPNFALRVQHSEVMVRVVVRDAKGKPVTNLQQDDFRILDNKKPQAITHFTLETAGGNKAPNPAAQSNESAAASSGGAAKAPQIILPTRFMALYFDDIHLAFEDLARTRDAADRYLATNLKPGDRAGVYTSSGQGQLDLTSDRDQLHDALMKLQPRPVFARNSSQCPQILPYQAYQIVDLQDPISTTVAQKEALQCYCPNAIAATSPASLGNLSSSAIAAGPAGGPGGCFQASPAAIRGEAVKVLQDAETESRYVLQGLERLCRRLEAVHGQHAVILVSPGFMSVTETLDYERVVDQALRQNVVISTLDARGVYTQNGLGDATQDLIYPSDASLQGSKVELTSFSKSMDGDVLMSLADATGGVYLHNDNDFSEAFERAGAFPEAYYTLTFSPADLKPDGRFHTLTAALVNNPEHYALQARKGYFAPRKDEDAASLANEEIETMAFSDNEIHTIPVEIHTQFFKLPSGEAKVSVLAHVDIGNFRFRKADGRNLDNLTLVTVLFNQAGDYVTGQEKDIEFHLQDSTVAKLTQIGVNTRVSLTVKPGTYAIREVVRESEGGQISALNSQVEIP
ncbi:MAG TPA: VWA domain-containing protein [Terriglobia bacterium]|nr:VWA domain-containing protein [Terriglobia bacterium]